MDTYEAFAMGKLNRGKEMKVFDWDKAARIIVEQKALYASAGLEDWDWTSGEILEDGQPIKKGAHGLSPVYLASTWATPVLALDCGTYECWKMKSEVPDWDADTYWPKSALKILEGE